MGKKGKAEGLRSSRRGTMLQEKRRMNREEEEEKEEKEK